MHTHAHTHANTHAHTRTHASAGEARTDNGDADDVVGDEGGDDCHERLRHLPPALHSQPARDAPRSE
eukprot:1905532-Rhodomonas_salina.1